MILELYLGTVVVKRHQYFLLFEIQTFSSPSKLPSFFLILIQPQSNFLDLNNNENNQIFLIQVIIEVGYQFIKSPYFLQRSEKILGSVILDFNSTLKFSTELSVDNYLIVIKNIISILMMIKSTGCSNNSMNPIEEQNALDFSNPNKWRPCLINPINPFTLKHVPIRDTFWDLLHKFNSYNNLTIDDITPYQLGSLFTRRLTIKVSIFVS
jgi:hypothetical protein